MLTKISLKNIASYNHLGTEFNELNKINFIYGNNGTGKSTFSKFFENVDEELYSYCSYEGNILEKRLVYNKEFIDDNFKIDSDIPGIFTLGHEHVEKQSELDKLHSNIEKNQQEKNDAIRNLQNTEREIEESKKDFIEVIWDRKKAKQDTASKLYQQAFKGLHNSKKRFFDEYIIQQNSSKTELINLDELFKNSEIIFSKDHSILPEILIFANEFEINSKILTKSIVGQEDLDFADLVTKLNIHTWVHEGYEIIEKKNLDYCPLCRTNLSEKIIRDISEYFNEKFESEILELRNTIKQYKEYSQKIIQYLSELTTLNNKYLSKELVETICLKIQAKHEENLKLLVEKERDPSKKINLNFFTIELDELEQQLKMDNEKIYTHNDKVSKIQEEEKKLVQDIWNYFLNLTEDEFKRFDKKIKQLQGKAKGLKESIDRKSKHIKKQKERIDEIENSMFGIISTVKAINKQLKLYGFRNFLLTSTDDERKYKIIRENGENANKTLSEGEKTFITFLYYYHIVKSEKKKKLLFIDDPISSLDSTILYIVSTLVKDLIESMDEYKIDQLFISTHNTYFFKEITYKINKCSYYIIRKNLEWGSYVKRYRENPITTSYESLWKELVELKDSSTSIVQNIMRRILENYFKFHGGIDINTLINHFDEDEKIVVSSLIKWAHDGSHYIQEDLYIQQQSEMNEKYFDIFIKIFINSGNEGHVKMMIKNCSIEDKDSPFKYFNQQIA